MDIEPLSNPLVSALPEMFVMSDRYCALSYNRKKTFIILKIYTNFVLLLAISIMLLSFFFVVMVSIFLLDVLQRSICGGGE